MLMESEDLLTSWVASQLPEAHGVHVEGLGRAEMGHSAETLYFTIGWDDATGMHHQDVVFRIRPPFPGLLEPYDLQRQFEVLRGLRATPVRAPRPLWFEPSGEVLGREFYVMERLRGGVYEQEVPAELAANAVRVTRMCEGMVEQIAAIHCVDLQATGLDAISDGKDYLDCELRFWSDEIERVKRGPLPALELLVETLRQQQPAQCPSITLVHGDAKPGNFAFEAGEVTAVYDWEMATIGDPRADIGWAELLWTIPGSFTTLPGALSVDQFVARWEQLTGIQALHRHWYRAFQRLKMATINLVGSHLVDVGDSDDLRFVDYAYAVHPITILALEELGVQETLPPGPVLPRKERRLELREAQRR
jgi:aminoglycoside phosphotransferase (APT) family kinase protein